MMPMMMLAAAMLLAAPDAAPDPVPDLAPQASPEAAALGRRMAETGTLATLLPMISAKEAEELVAAHPELSEADRATLRATAKETAEKGIGRLLDAQGDAYAAALSIEDLRVLVGFNGTDAARNYRAAQPQVIAATMKGMAGLDYKKDVMAAFCAKTGKGCAAK